MNAAPEAGKGVLFLRLVRHFFPTRRDWGPWSARRALALAVFVPPFLLLQLVHWAGFLLDDVFFRAYRDVPLREPLFVIGLPRSGTSYLQRVLARDEGTTTMRLWELVLAPSVTERKLWLALGRVDRAMGRPLSRLFGWGQRKATAWMDDVHPVALDEPEEDFLVLLSGFACFLLVLAFPGHREVWRLTRFDEWPAAERTAVLSFYRSCLQRHMYVVGPQKRLLSKNPSFTPFARSLAEAFPDARFLCCVRDPREAVPSQLSAVAGGMRLFGTDVARSPTRERLVSMMEHYANHVLAASGSVAPDRWVFVPLAELRRDVAGTVERAYERFGWMPDATFRATLRDESLRARRYRSTHAYSLAELNLSNADLARRFASFIDRFEFGRPSSEPAHSEVRDPGTSS